MKHSAQAFLFDLNGTLINDMDFHGKVWYQLLTEELGANLTREEVKRQMYGKNDELLARIFGKNHFSPQEVEKWSIEKEKRYQRMYLPYLKLIAGANLFIERATENNIQMAIGSAAIPFNIDFVLDNLHIRPYFQAIVSADDVKESKPHPETFLKAAQLLQIRAADCIVFEDTPKGVEASQNAGMRCIVITTTHPKEDFSPYKNIIGFIEDYTDSLITNLF